MNHPTELPDLIGFDDSDYTEGRFDVYQKWLSDILVRNEIALIGAFMGSGKTGVSLHAFKRLRLAGVLETALVVAPYYVATETWPEEIQLWSFSMGLRFSVMVGTPDQRTAALDADADIYIINRENLVWFCAAMRTRKWKFDLLIYDEASRLKSGKKRTQGKLNEVGVRVGINLTEFGALSKIKHLFKYKWELTGTPSPNGLIDLWGPIYILDEGDRLGNKREAYIRRWFSTDRYTYRVEPLPFAEKQIMGRLKDVFWYLDETDYINLPELQVVDRHVSLGKTEAALYKEFEREKCLEEPDVEAVNNAVLCNKLLQFANGSVYAEADEDHLLSENLDVRRKSVAKHIHDRKLHELASIIEEAAGRPILLAYSYRFDLQAIKKRFPFAKIYGEDKNDRRNWNAGKYRLMMLHPGSAAHGLNFQKGGNLAVWYGLNWSLELYLQFNKRLHRRGQEASFVRLYRILARDTMDDRVAILLETKGVNQQSLLEHVRVHVNQVRGDLI